MSFNYDVALSFAGEDRAYAEELANKLKERGVQVFYDNWNISSLWGENLYTFLGKTYRDNSLFCISLISEAYCEKIWTKHEMKFIQARELNGEVYWLPLFLENANIPELPETKGRVCAWEHGIDQIVGFVCEKIEKRKQEINDGEIPEPKIMSIQEKDGSIEQVEVIVSFAFNDNHKEYVVYTKNEKDSEGNITIYVSNIEQKNGGYVLKDVANNEEWDRIKEVLRELSGVNDDAIHTPHFGDDGIEIL